MINWEINLLSSYTTSMSFLLQKVTKNIQKEISNLIVYVTMDMNFTRKKGIELN